MTSLTRLLSFVGVLFACSCSKPPAPEKTEAAASAAPATSASATAAAAPAPPPVTGEPLKIAYSDWPGWVAWDIAIQKGWFKEAGVNVDFKWFEYVPSMETFSAGKVDAVAITNGDALVTGATGGKSTCILANDYSNGNDMVVAKPGIKSIADLKGKKVGVEVGFVSHLLLLNALKSANLTAKDVKIVNTPTDQTPQMLKSGKVDAIVAWQPNSGAALSEVPGSTAIFTERERARHHLRHAVREPEEPGGAPRRLGQGGSGLGPRRQVREGREERGRRGPHHGRARRPARGAVQGPDEGHVLPHPRGREEALEGRARPRVDLRIEPRRG